MKLNKDFPRKIFLDKRVLVNGIKRNYVNYENHIELHEWIQDLIDAEEIDIPCGCDPAPTPEKTIPQACITTHFKQYCNNPNHSEVPCPPTKYFSSFFSCSATTLLEGCTKSYKIFNTKTPSEEILSYDTVDEINALFTSWETLPPDLAVFGEIYHIIEYINCGTDSTESLPVYFEIGIRNTSINPAVKSNVPEIVLVDEDYTDIRDMGNITASMVNGEAGTEIFINPNKIVYSNEYIEAWYLTMVEPFDAIPIDSCNFTSTLGNLNITGINLTDDMLKIVQPVTGNIIPAVINDCTFYIKFDLGGGETNPQTFTQGVLNLKAKVKKYPI